MPRSTRQSAQLRTYLFWFAAALVAFLLYAAREVFVPVALAILLSFLLSPVCDRLERWGVRRVPGVISTALLAFGLLAAVITFIFFEFQELTQDIPAFRAEVSEKVKTVSRLNSSVGGRLGGFLGEVATSVDQAAEEAAEEAAESAEAEEAQNSGGRTGAAAGDSLLGNWTSIIPGSTPQQPLYTRVVPEKDNLVASTLTSLQVVLGPLGTAGLVVVFVLFLLLYRDDLRDRVVYLFSSSNNFVVTTSALRDASERISRYIVAQSLLNAGYAVIVTLGLLAIGLFSDREGGFPNPFLWGFLCGLLRFIPYIGPIAGAMFPLAMSLAAFDGYTVFFAVFALIIAIELLSNNVIEPWVYGSSTGLSSVAIIIAAVFWSWLWGPVGLLLSTPLTVCLVAFGNHIPQLQTFAVLLGDEGSLSAPIRLYQRLLNGDAVKAKRLIDSEVERIGMVDTIDECFLPVIRRMRRDYERELLHGSIKQEFTDAMGEVFEHLGREYPDDDGERADEEAAARARAAAAIQKAEATDLPSITPPVNVAEAVDEGQDGAAAPPAPPLPRVLLIPAHDVVEEQLLQLLARQFTATAQCRVLPTRRLPSDLKRLLTEWAPDLIVIGLVPPGGMLQTEFICRQIAEASPKTQLIAAYFSRIRRFDRLLLRLRKRGVHYLVTSFEQAMRHIQAGIDDFHEKQPPPEAAASRSQPPAS